MKQVLLIIFIIQLSCNVNNSYKMDSGSTFFPNIKILEGGVVWKYYIHQIDNKTKTTSSDIRYLRYQLVSENKITEEQFSAGYRKTSEKQILINKNEWIIVNEKSFLTNGDTLSYQFKKNIMLDWENPTATSYALKENKYFSLENRIQQTAIIDSIADKKKIKTFYKDAEVLHVRKRDTSKINYKTKKMYTENIGMTFYQSISENTTYEWELVEVFTSKEFDKRSTHGTNRVAFIDTAQTMDDSNKFKLCDKTSNIADYYNDDIAQFIGGKGSLKAYLEKYLIKEKLGNESGYLSYRFVVNCNGESGWFVTEEADLSFMPKSFNNTIKEHLFTILKSVKDWKYLTIRDTPRDAYVYITFKLKNGKIIEILP